MRGGYQIRAYHLERWERNSEAEAEAEAETLELPSNHPFSQSLRSSTIGYHLIEEYFEAASPRGKLYTNCGHKHHSYEEATECIPAVEAAYRAKRWPKKVRA